MEAASGRPKRPREAERTPPCGDGSPAAPAVETPPGAADTPSKALPPAGAAAGADAGVAAMAVDAPPAEAVPPGAKGKAKGAPRKQPAASEWGEKLAAAHRVFLDEKTSRRMYRLWDARGVDPDWLVGRQVRVLWPDDGFPYAGTVDAYNPADGTHCVTYDDGQEEWIEVGKEQVRLLLHAGEMPPPPPSAAAEAPAAAEAEAAAEGAPVQEAAPEAEPAVEADAAGPPLPEGMDAVGFRIAVFWPGDSTWAEGSVEWFDARRGLHTVAYDNGRQESLSLASERVRVLGRGGRRGAGLAATPQGELVWGKVKGYPAWPALVVGEAEAAVNGRMKPPAHGAAPTLAVQYFGSAEHGRCATSASKNAAAVAMSFEDGMVERAWSRGKDARFREALAQAEAYLRSGELSEKMGGGDWPDNPEWDSDADEEAPPGSAAAFWADAVGVPEEDPTLPWALTPALTIERLGRIEYIRPAYHTPRALYPIGYSATRRAPAEAGGRLWRCEIVDGGDAPLFRVSVVAASGAAGAAKVLAMSAAVFEAGHPTDAWYKMVAAEAGAARAAAPAAGPATRGDAAPGGGAAAAGAKRGAASGAEMFGLTQKKVTAALQRLPDAPRCDKYQAWEGGVRPKAPPPDAAQVRAAAARAAAHLRLPAGVTAVHQPPPPDRCAVCDLATEWDDDQLVQCDACRMLVHMKCYGVAHPPDGSPWACAACDLRLPAPPPCALCPVAGGAMKPTTCGKWAHVACAQWVPETTFLDPERVEPVDGIGRIGRARLSLRCGICRQPYGACVQCAGGAKCYATYHPLCARGRGYRMEVREGPAVDAPPPPVPGAPAPPRRRVAAKGLDGKAVTGLGDGLFLASFCPRCGPGAGPPAKGAPRFATPVKGAKKARTEAAPEAAQAAEEAAEEAGPPGCARTVPLDWSLRRVRREPAAIQAFLAKRAFVAATPYVVTGRRHVPPLAPRLGAALPPTTPDGEPAAAAPPPASLAERYAAMRASWASRLTCGKSAIHGWGAFTKVRHQAGDMVIEYCGELVRPVVAELREARCYDALVGAGTYVFRRDDAAVVDATRAGNMAHLINHSCAPNCYSRLVTVAGETHIVLFALRDIEAGVEISYDYRFASESERLPCNCGAPKCRGFVNIDAADADDDDEAPPPKAQPNGLPPLPDGWLWAHRDQVEVVGQL